MDVRKLMSALIDQLEMITLFVRDIAQSNATLSKNMFAQILLKMAALNHQLATPTR